MTDHETTLEVPLPEGTRPNPDTVTTQEIPVVSTIPIPVVHAVVPPVPWRLVGDPILTMAAPEPDDTSLYEQLHGPPPRKPRCRRRRKMPTGDKVLAGMGAATMVGVAVIYGMVAYGWGAGPLPQDTMASRPPSRPPVSVRPNPSPDAPTSYYTPPAAEETVVTVAEPETYAPAPTRSVVVIAPPETAPVQTSEEPEPVQAPSAPETASKPPEPTQTTPSPTKEPSDPPEPSESVPDESAEPEESAGG